MKYAILFLMKFYEICFLPEMPKNRNNSALNFNFIISIITKKKK